MEKRYSFAKPSYFLLFLLVFISRTNLAFCADNFYVIAGSTKSSDITQLQSAVLTLQQQVSALQGRIFPYGLVNMYEDSNVKIELTGESKTVTDPTNNYTTVAFRLLITNKTTNNIYIGYEASTSSVIDEYGKGELSTRLYGINLVYSTEANGNYYSAISPRSTLTANWTSDSYQTTFYNSHYLTASFGFVLFNTSGNTRFNAGFTGIYLP